MCISIELAWQTLKYEMNSFLHLQIFLLLNLGYH